MANKKTINIDRQIFEFTEVESNEIVRIMRSALASYMHSRNMILGPERDKVQLLLNPVVDKPGLFKVMAIIEEAKEKEDDIKPHGIIPPSESMN